ncbi:unnamed protein product [Diamesa tonsa]
MKSNLFLMFLIVVLGVFLTPAYGQSCKSSGTYCHEVGDCMEACAESDVTIKSNDCAENMSCCTPKVLGQTIDKQC